MPGYSYPLREKWVVMFVCRLHHHGPTSDEVGMRKTLARAQFYGDVSIETSGHRLNISWR
jgi:hypothetical protein